MKKNKMNLKIIIGIFIITTFLSLGYLSYIFIDKYYNKKIEDNFNKGYEDGALQMGVYIMSQVVTCKPLPISYGNYSLTLIAQECLKW